MEKARQKQTVFWGLVNFVSDALGPKPQPVHPKQTVFWDLVYFVSVAGKAGSLQCMGDLAISCFKLPFSPHLSHQLRFPKLGIPTFLWGPYSKDYSISGSI